EPAVLAEPQTRVDPVAVAARKQAGVEADRLCDRHGGVASRLRVPRAAAREQHGADRGKDSAKRAHLLLRAVLFTARRARRSNWITAGPRGRRDRCSAFGYNPTLGRGGAR